MPSPWRRWRRRHAIMPMRRDPPRREAERAAVVAAVSVAAARLPTRRSLARARALARLAAASAPAIISRHRPRRAINARPSSHSRRWTALGWASCSSAARVPIRERRTAWRRGRPCAATSAHPLCGAATSRARSARAAAPPWPLTPLQPRPRAAAALSDTATMRATGRRRRALSRPTTRRGSPWSPLDSKAARLWASSMPALSSSLSSAGWSSSLRLPAAAARKCLLNIRTRSTCMLR